MKERKIKKGIKRGKKPPTHRFLFSKDCIATCTCGRWALAKAPWLAKQYGFPFKELTEEQARKDWAYHIQNLPGERQHVQGVLGKQRLKKILAAS